MKQDPSPNTLRIIDTTVSGLTALFASEMRRVDGRGDSEQVGRGLKK